tara:strand:+ start:7216 stop:7446 length:231 start_codon:yes stop_codon:yes gene_type:complete
MKKINKKYKFKVGDLVVLSAIGNNNYGNTRAFDQILLVTRLRQERDFPIQAVTVKDFLPIHFQEAELQLAKVPPKQ